MLEEMVTYPSKIIPHPDSDERRVIRDHKYYIINHPKTKKVPLVSVSAYPERRNFYAYCLEQRIAPELIYPMMLINEINNNMEFKDDMEYILMPDGNVIADILETIVR